jgi:transposase
MSEIEKKPAKLVRDLYTIEVNYSPEAIEKKLMRFSTPAGYQFEISADEMASILIGQVNSDLVEATFVESDRVNVVDVTRQIRARADRDIAAGEEIRLEYTHPYPVEFAIIEEAAKLCKIRMDAPRHELTVEYIQSVKEKITPRQRRFVDLVYKFFKNLIRSEKADTDV